MLKLLNMLMVKLLNLLLLKLAIDCCRLLCALVLLELLNLLLKMLIVVGYIMCSKEL